MKNEKLNEKEKIVLKSILTKNYTKNVLISDKITNDSSIHKILLQDFKNEKEFLKNMITLKIIMIIYKNVFINDILHIFKLYIKLFLMYFFKFYK